jgi:hypothetical protein
LDLEADRLIIERQIENNLENWKKVCRAYRNPILEFDVGKTNSENKRKT